MLPNLKRLRQENQISQQNLADEIGVSQQSINQYENHDIEPDISTLIKIADFFNTSVDFIVGKSEKRWLDEQSKPFDLNPDEADLIDMYRRTNESGKRCVEIMLKTLLEK